MMVGASPSMEYLIGAVAPKNPREAWPPPGAASKAVLARDDYPRRRRSKNEAPRRLKSAADGSGIVGFERSLPALT